ncbi:MAG: DUF1648 domain-containing protein [Ruminococcaceae bacterium]|nr:DUF1648 domain-containing protein [Oscillospiraceae bacterium]
MIKTYWRKLLLASLVTLLPITAGMVLWYRLPASMATHWGASGEADGYASKVFAVFGIPLILLAVFWVCVFVSAKDPKNKDQNPKALGMALWIVPVLSCFVNGFMYATALGWRLNLPMLLCLLFGLLFIVLGNYMPKCKQNFTLGIKIRPTLESKENWNATHRVAGKVWFFGGLAVLMCVFLPQSVSFIVLLTMTAVFVAVPVVYSYVYRHKQLKAKKNDIVPLAKTAQTKAGVWITAIAVPLILLLVAGLMFTGEISASIEGDTLVVSATYWEKSVIPLDQLHHIQYTEDHDVGMRVSGFQSAKLQLGMFQNDLYGTYTLYAYNNADFHILINDGDRVLVLALKDEQTTKAFYEELLEVIG